MLSAFDPGSRRMGFCVGDGTKLPVCGAWRFPQAGENLGAMLVWLDDELERHFDQYRPVACCYEAPILLRHDTLGRVRKTFSLGAHIEYVCQRRSVPCFEVPLQAVKAALAGTGSDKDAMVLAAERLGVELPASKADGREDAADAVGVWLAFLRAREPAATVKFDRALHGSFRGELF